MTALFKTSLRVLAFIALTASPPLQAQTETSRHETVASEYLNKCPKMPRSTAEGEACFTAERQIDRILRKMPMDDATRARVSRYYVYSVSRVATHYILTSQAELGCKHANRWRQDFDLNQRDLNVTNQSNIAALMVEGNGNFGQIQAKCLEKGITGIAAPLVNSGQKPLIATSPKPAQPEVFTVEQLRENAKNSLKVCFDTVSGPQGLKNCGIAYIDSTTLLYYPGTSMKDKVTAHGDRVSAAYASGIAARGNGDAREACEFFKMSAKDAKAYVTYSREVDALMKENGQPEPYVELAQGLAEVADKEARQCN